VIPAIQGDSDLQLLTQTGLTINGIAVPTDTKPFDDVRVRQALNYAVDKKAINDSLYKGLAVTMTSPLPPAEWGFDDSLKGYPYDPEKAKALLKEAGYPDGFKTELLAYTSARGYNPAGPQLAVAVQGYLKQIGVEASVQQIEFGAYLAKARSGKYDGMFMVGWSGDNGDPDNFVGEIFGSEHIPITNMARFRNPDLDNVLQQARRESDHAKRVELYQQAQKMIVEGAPWIMVNSTLQVRAARKEVKGFQLNPTQMFFDMEKVSLEP
jgi:peptide/nickel transport system substrate-binding protein